MRAKIAALTLALTLSSAPSFASDFFLLDQTKVGRSNNVFWLDVGADMMNHKDPDLAPPTIPFTSEHGAMPMLQVGVSALGNVGWFLSASATIAGGSTDYTGFDSGVPDTGETDETIFTFASQIGWNISPFESVTFIPYVEGNWRYWNRKLVGDLEYSHLAVLGGAKLQFAPTKPTVLSLYGAYGNVLSPKVDTNTTSMDPEEGSIYRIGAKFAYTPTSSPRYEAFIATEYSSFEYEESATYPTNSTTRELTTRVGLGYRFR